MLQCAYRVQQSEQHCFNEMFFLCVCVCLELFIQHVFQLFKTLSASITSIQGAISQMHALCFVFYAFIIYTVSEMDNELVLSDQ